MLRNLFRVLSDDSRLIREGDEPPVVRLAHVSTAANEPGSLARSDRGEGNLLPLKPNASHRARLYSMRLEYIRLCSPHRCERLRRLGIVTAGDLASASPERLASQFRASRRAQRVLKQYRRAIRFAASVPGMMPRDAMLLISIHRRSVRGLSLESASILHRDLERFAQSSQGKIQMGGRRIPSTRRLKRWINQCKESSILMPMQSRVA